VGFGSGRRDQAARKASSRSRRGPAGPPNTIEVRERAGAQGIEVKTAAGYPLTDGQIQGRYRPGLRRSNPAKVVVPHAHADVSVLIEGFTAT